MLWVITTLTFVATFAVLAAIFYAFAPGGELLLSDTPNDYAVIGNDVVPLKCEKTFSKSYFEKN